MEYLTKKSSKHNIEIAFRYPVLEDAEKMMNFINVLSNEKTFITMQGEQMTLDEEVSYLKTLLKLIENKEGSTILAFNNDELIGIVDLRLRVRVFKHTGEIALSVCKSHRNQGIGLLLLEVLIEDIFRNFPELEILTLQVFANNDSGIRLYENFGMEHFLKA